jgi:hypothetical protein
MGESQHPDPGSGMNNPDHIFLELRTIFCFFWGLKYLNSLRIRDPVWKQFGSRIQDPGSGINIPDPPHWFQQIALRKEYLKTRAK